MWRVDCLGFSDASQETKRSLKVKGRETVIVVAHFPGPINNSSSAVSSDCFEMNILRHIAQWVVIEKQDLFSYSVQQSIGSAKI